jgi:hypothetical protein
MAAAEGGERPENAPPPEMLPCENYEHLPISAPNIAAEPQVVAPSEKTAPVLVATAEWSAVVSYCGGAPCAAEFTGRPGCFVFSISRTFRGPLQVHQCLGVGPPFVTTHAEWLQLLVASGAGSAALSNAPTVPAAATISTL